MTKHSMIPTPVLTGQPKAQAWHSLSAEESLAQLGASVNGLSAQEAARRLGANGPNLLKEGKRISPVQIFPGQFKGLIIWILIAAGVISGLLGESVDAIAILAIVVLNAVIGFYQEFNAEKSIEALKKMTAPQAKVWRDGQVTSIPASGIVTGDILALLFGLGFLHGTDLFELFMTSVSLAVAAVPEGLPAVVTVALSLGVLRMSRRHALVRKLRSRDARLDHGHLHGQNGHVDDG